MRYVSLFLVLLMIQACGKKIASTPQPAPVVMDTLMIDTGKDTIQISVPQPDIKEEPKVTIDDLNFNFFGWPFSFWSAAQGSLIVYVVIIWFYAHYMNQLDQEHGLAEVEED